MTSLPGRTAPIREKRAGEIAAYAGTAGALLAEAGEGGLAPRTRTFAQDRPSDVQRALSLLRTVEGLGVVVHGPAGCAASLLGEEPGAPWVVSGLTQRDSILGGDAKLREAIRQLHAPHHVQAIAVVGTPVVAINNDDVEAVAAELREELGLPIALVRTDGFRSRVGATGHDVAVHGLLEHLLPVRHTGPGDHVTILTGQEGPEEVAEVRALLQEAGIGAVPFPRHARVNELEAVASARLSVSLDPDEAAYAAQALRQLRGVPHLDAPPPIGLSGTTRWLAAVAAAAGQEEGAAEVAAQHAASLEAVRARLAPHAGAPVFVNLPAAWALAVGALVRELGLSLAGLQVPALGPRHLPALRELTAGQPDLPLLVGEGQAFEEVNLLHRLRPAVLVTRGAAPVHALRLGIPVLDLHRVPLLGYAGAQRFAEELRRRLRSQGLARFLATGGPGRWAPGWLDRSTHWFIKHEVK
ncbi:MAG: nitrogenase component 1 [Anaeromyxobacter sp.]